MKPKSIFYRFLFLAIGGGGLVIITIALLIANLVKPSDLDLDRRGIRVWVIDGGGNTVLSNSKETMPSEWTQSPRNENTVSLVALKESKGYVIALPISKEPERTIIVKLGQPLLADRTSGIVKATTLIFAIFGSITALVFFLMLYYWRDKAQIARRVLTEIEQGNLKVRFPINRVDEFGLMMIQFNKMADQIESLVASLKEAETARTRLLRELAHDIRTPLTALRFVVETVGDCADQFTPEQISQKMTEAERELNYFVRLIEDLFLLAEVGESNYKAEIQSVNFSTILKMEVDSASSRLSTANREIKVRLHENNTTPIYVRGDEHLIRRLIRNAIENSMEHAMHFVDVSVESIKDEKFTLKVKDDGPGLTPEAIEGFGKRRASRYLEGLAGKEKISLGLGSVIMKAIAKSHHGQISIGNLRDGMGRVIGAELVLTLPKTGNVGVASAA